MAEIEVENKIHHSIYNLLFLTIITGNVIQVFACYEEFMNKQHILQ